MPPIGPLGAHMKLSPKTTPIEAKLIEYVLRNLLRTFIADNFEDKRYFVVKQSDNISNDVFTINNV